jgi:hypothetical protein
MLSRLQISSMKQQQKTNNELEDLVTENITRKPIKSLKT